MKKPRLFGWMTAMALAMALPALAQAQFAADPHRFIALRIEGLTSADRDAVQGGLKGREDLKLVFACVPAGILVFEGDARNERKETEARAMTVLQEKTGRSRVSQLQDGLAEAETACAEMRNR